MEKGKSPAKLRRKKTLEQSLTEPESHQPLVPEAWDFRNVPSDEIEPCYLYEYSKASPLILSKITDALERRLSPWFKSNPEPTKETERKIWLEKMLSEVGEIDARTELEQEIHFVVDFAEEEIFPKRHWLKIDRKRRRNHAVQEDRWRVGEVDAAGMAAKPLLFYPLEYFLELSRRVPNAGLRAKDPDHSGPHVFDVCWARSTSKLKKDFEQWLKNNRPKDQPGFQKSAQGGSRHTTPGDLLKALGALRLMRAFRGNAMKARCHTLDSPLSKPLYKEQTAWINAARKAEEHLVIFQRSMLGI
jgi:hypothetical protein